MRKWLKSLSQDQGPEGTETQVRFSDSLTGVLDGVPGVGPAGFGEGASETSLISPVWTGCELLVSTIPKLNYSQLIKCASFSRLPYF